MTEPLLSSTQADLLTLMLETLIPASPARGLPSAAKVGFVEFAVRKGLGTKLMAALDAIAVLARKHHGAEFASLEPATRLALLTDRGHPQSAAMGDVQNSLLQCYYQNPLVVVAIGMQPRAPFPEGYHVEEGDLLLLEPVFLREKIYRDV